MIAQENSVIIFQRAAQMLAQADTIQKAKELKDLALTAADWARRKGLGEEAIRYARSYAMEAERKIGELCIAEAKAGRLATRERNPGTLKGRDSSGVPTRNIRTATTAEIGLTRKQRAEAEFKAKLPRETFQAVRDGKKTVAAAKREIKQGKRRNLAERAPDGKFAVILADPPWQYDNSGFDEAAEAQYQTMPTDEICRMGDRVKGWSTDETVLFLWATNPMLEDALRVMAAWGFDYKTNMAWVKDRGRGKGWFLKSRHELLLIGVRKNTPHPVERPDSAFMADRPSKHSQKPDVVYSIIEKMFTGKKLEMFSRNRRDGWEAHGNECS